MIRKGHRGRQIDVNQDCTGFRIPYFTKRKDEKSLDAKLCTEKSSNDAYNFLNTGLTEPMNQINSIMASKSTAKENWRFIKQYS